MKSKILALYVILLVCLSSVFLAQTKLMNEADGFFNEKRYREAYATYTKVYQKKKDKEVLLKMADCNYFVENYPVAQKYYEQYFSDTLYHPTPQYTYFAISSRQSGKLDLAYNLYRRLDANAGNADTRSFLESCRLYLDSANKIRVYNVDSSYTCVDLDATASHDELAAPMTYVWDFKDGAMAEGVTVSHCFKKTGANRITLSIRDKATGYVKLNDTALVVFIEAPPVKFDCPKRLKQYFYNTLDASKLSIDNYEILEYIWDLGEGVIQTGKKVQRKFDKLGNYTVRLTVVAKSNITGGRSLFAACKWVEVVDNYADHSQTFKDGFKGER